MLQVSMRLFERIIHNSTQKDDIPNDIPDSTPDSIAMISKLTFLRKGGIAVALMTAFLLSALSACQTGSGSGSESGAGSSADSSADPSADSQADFPTDSSATIQNGAHIGNKFLLGVDWGIVELDGMKDQREIRGMGGSAVFIHLDSGAAFGHAGCNRFNAQYTLDGNSLSFGPAAMTKMYCDGLMEIESGVARVLSETDSYAIQNDTLRLLKGSKVLAKLVRIAQ